MRLRKPIFAFTALVGLAGLLSYGTDTTNRSPEKTRQASPISEAKEDICANHRLFPESGRSGKRLVFYALVLDMDGTKRIDKDDGSYTYESSENHVVAVLDLRETIRYDVGYGGQRRITGEIVEDAINWAFAIL